MAIVEMSKFELFSFNQDREKILKALQKFNYVHFNKLENPEIDEEDEIKNINNTDLLIKIDEEISKNNEIIKLLRRGEEKKGLEKMKEGLPRISIEEIIRKSEAFDYEVKVKELDKLFTQRSELEQEKYDYTRRIEELAPWENLEVAIRELRKFKYLDLFIGTILNKNIDELVQELDTLETVEVIKVGSQRNIEYVIDYIIVASTHDKSEETEQILKEQRFRYVNFRTKEIPKIAKENYKRKLKEVNVSLAAVNAKIEGYVEFLDDFRIYNEYLKNNKLKTVASENFLQSSNVNIIQGYVPTHLEKEFTEILIDTVGNDYYLQINKADRDDPDTPIILENNKFVKPFESITEMYALPKYNEIDPTPLLAPWYFLFAGIMVGDLGYGLLLFIVSIIGLKKFNLDEGKKKMLKFLSFLSISTMVWGIIYGSFFGGVIPMKAFLDPAEDYFQMIFLSLILGGLHLFFGLGIKAYMDIRDGKPLDALFDVGFWYMAVMGAIVSIVSFVMKLEPIIFQLARIVMILGMVGIVLTGGRDQKSIAGKLGWGIYELYGISSYFGDFVSYLRLMALALSGTFIAVAVNMIVRMLLAKGIMGIILGVIIFIVFQMFNLFLSFLSAYVHTARLIFVEMFNKFYEGGGKPFKKMIAESDFFDIK